MLADLLGGLLRAENRNEEEDDDVIEVDGEPHRREGRDVGPAQRPERSLGRPRDESDRGVSRPGNDWVRFLAECERQWVHPEGGFGAGGSFWEEGAPVPRGEGSPVDKGGRGRGFGGPTEDRKPLPELFALVSGVGEAAVARKVPPRVVR